MAIQMHANTALLAGATLPIGIAGNWLVIVAIAVLSVIIVAAVIYMLSGIINSQNARAWARNQIYEALLTFLFIVMFSSAIMYFFLNPQHAFSSVNLVPTGCSTATQIFTLASCDVAQFNNATYSLSGYILEGTYIVSIVSGLAPSISVNPIPFQRNIKLGIAFPSLFPSGTTNLMGKAYGAMLVALMFNQVQLMLLSGSVLLLGFFLSLGLLARTFGFSRSFGGAMIAFGIGLGLVYPLITAITYGYIDVQANVMCIQSFICSSGAALKTASTGVVGVGTIIYGFTDMLFVPWTAFGTSILSSAVASFFKELGYIIIGLTVVPLLNIVIVDAFIIDFSNAIGERMSFGQLFSNLI